MQPWAQAPASSCRHGRRAPRTVQQLHGRPGLCPRCAGLSEPAPPGPLLLALLQAGIEAESRRLAAFIDKASKEAGRVTYPHDPLRVRMAKHGVPWDPSLLVELRWGAQVAAAALMAAALDQARELSKCVVWCRGLVLCV